MTKSSPPQATAPSSKRQSSSTSQTGRKSMASSRSSTTSSLPTSLDDAAVAPASDDQTDEERAAQEKAVKEVMDSVVASNQASKTFNDYIASWEEKKVKLSDEDRFTARVAFDAAWGAWAVARQPIPRSTEVLNIKLPDKNERFKVLAVLRLSSFRDLKALLAKHDLPVIARDLVKASWHLPTPDTVDDPMNSFQHANPAGNWELYIDLPVGSASVGVKKKGEADEKKGKAGEKKASAKTDKKVEEENDDDSGDESEDELETRGSPTPRGAQTVSSLMSCGETSRIFSQRSTASSR